MGQYCTCEDHRVRVSSCYIYNTTGKSVGLHVFVKGIGIWHVDYGIPCTGGTKIITQHHCIGTQDVIPYACKQQQVRTGAISSHDLNDIKQEFLRELPKWCLRMKCTVGLIVPCIQHQQCAHALFEVVWVVLVVCCCPWRQSCDGVTRAGNQW